MVRENKKGTQYYFTLEYPYIVTPDEDEFFVRFPDLPGCMTQVERSEDIHSTAQEIKELWIESALDSRQPIPEPASEEFSGKFIVRVPKTLHRDLVYQAKQEGMSLNSYVLHLLSERGLVSRLESLITSPKPAQFRSAKRPAKKTNSSLVDHHVTSYWRDQRLSAEAIREPRRTRRSQATSYSGFTRSFSEFLQDQVSSTHWIND